MSKFKPLAMVAGDNPGAFFGTDDARTEGEVDASDLEKAEQALVELGYVAIPEELLTNRFRLPPAADPEGLAEVTANESNSDVRVLGPAEAADLCARLPDVSARSALS